jgi:hypothetical protein
MFLTHLITLTWHLTLFDYSRRRALVSLAAVSGSLVSFHKVSGNLCKQFPLKSEKRLFTVGLTMCEGHHA